MLKFRSALHYNEFPLFSVLEVLGWALHFVKNSFTTSPPAVNVKNSIRQDILLISLPLI
jgi:hypothetical protein